MYRVIVQTPAMLRPAPPRTGVGALLVLLLLITPSHSHAARITGPVQVAPSDVRVTSVTIRIRKQQEQHSISCIGATAGIVRSRRSRLIFTSYGRRAKVLNERGSAALKLTRFRRLAKVGNRACANLLRTDPPNAPTPTPAPNLTPTATPRPTSTPRPPNFDENGNVTARGRVVFGIPSGLPANRFTGAAVYQNRCSDCHGGEQRGLFFNFMQLRNATSGFPMLFNETTLLNEELAHITAFLNQGNP